MKEAAHKWAEQARYDLETARAMLAAERHLYVLFCCQQAMEKALKALIVERSGEFPPRIHSLPRLAQSCELSLDDEVVEFLAELSAFYVQTRYPEEIESLGVGITHEKAEAAFTKTEETMQWLFSMLK